MKRFPSLLILIALALWGTARAADVHVAWTQSNQYTDGNPLPASQVTGNRVAWGTCNGTAFGTKLGEHKLAPSTSDTITGLTPGTYCVLLFTTATLTGATPTESDPSNPVSVTVATPVTPKPKPPSGGAASVVTIAPTVYTISKVRDGLVALPVGTAPVGTACDTSQPVLGFYVIPSASVTWTGTVRTLAAVASCG